MLGLGAGSRSTWPVGGERPTCAFPDLTMRWGKPCHGLLVARADPAASRHTAFPSTNGEKPRPATRNRGQALDALMSGLSMAIPG